MEYVWLVVDKILVSVPGVSPITVLYGIQAVVMVAMLFCCWGIYYSFRRAFGHERFKGHWYSPEQFQSLKEELYTGVRNGRLPDSETMALLDRHVYGKVSTLRSWNGNGWL